MRGIRRRWRKLHLGVDADTHEVVAVELTQDDVGDVSQLEHYRVEWNRWGFRHGAKV